MTKKRELKVYGVWAGNSRGVKEDETMCVKTVHDTGYLSHGRQCSRKRGHGKDGLYCKQHDLAAVKMKDDEKRKKWREGNENQEAIRRRLEILQKMARGIHTDKLKKYKLKPC